MGIVLYKWQKSQAKVRKVGGMLNDVERHELCASLVNKENKNCDAVGLEGGVKARVRDEGMDPDSVILQDTDSLFFRSTVVESINALRKDVAALRSEVRLQRGSGCSRRPTPSPVKFCMLYVSFMVALQRFLVRSYILIQFIGEYSG